MTSDLNPIDVRCRSGRQFRAMPHAVADDLRILGLGRIRSRIREQGFTLIELMVVMGLIAILGAMTALGYRTVAKDAKLSSGKNTVMAVLDNARGLAMKTNRIVLVVFRPRWDGPKDMYVEAVLCKFSGESFDCPAPLFGIVDRFVPIPNTPTRSLPRGIKVAGPRYGQTDGTYPGFDRTWVTQTQLTAINQGSGAGEVLGGLIAVMYGSDGTVITRNSSTDSVACYVDFDGNHLQRKRNSTASFVDYTLLSPPYPGNYYEQAFEDDEPLLDIEPFLAVYDDDKARELRATDWMADNDYKNELIGNEADSEPGGFINKNADRIHFNRYTGVAMK